jgi:hypothetical protein
VKIKLNNQSKYTFMSLKLKPIVEKIQSEQAEKAEKESAGKILLSEFLSLASTEPYKDDDVWEKLRQTTTPNKYQNVDEMFKRWKELVNYNRDGK